MYGTPTPARTHGTPTDADGRPRGSKTIFIARAHTPTDDAACDAQLRATGEPIVDAVCDISRD